jgi:hypothetical protein
MHGSRVTIYTWIVLYYERKRVPYKVNVPLDRFLRPDGAYPGQ